MKILKRDFDAATRHPWHPQTCLIAQAGKRQGILRESDGGSDNLRIVQASDEARNARNVFDLWFSVPGDEKKPALQALRASLPITVTLSAPNS